MNLTLNRHPLNQFQSLFSDKVETIYPRFVSEVNRLVGPAHAQLFARPEITGDYIRWECDGNQSLAWQALSPVQKEQLLNTVQQMLSDIRQVACNHPESFIYQLLPNWHQLPSFDYLYAVDGKPVITNWGYTNTNGARDLLTNNDVANIPHSPRSKFLISFPWITALIAFFLGLLAALLWSVVTFSKSSCLATYPSKDQIAQVQNDISKNKQLLDQKNNLLKNLQDLNKKCQIPPVVPLKPKDMEPVQPLPDIEPSPDVSPEKNLDLPPVDMPQKKAEAPKPNVPLPKTAWDNKDLSMFKGCWHLTTPLFLITPRLFHTSTEPIRDWSLCFDQNGNGRQVLTSVNGTRCQGPLRANFQGQQVILSQPAECSGDFTLIGGRNTCVRVNDHEASCDYVDNEGRRTRGFFRR